MRTTLNLPDSMVREAKLRALQENATLTDLLVQGLVLRLLRSSPVKTLPVSKACGGLCAGVDWISLSDGSIENEGFR